MPSPIQFDGGSDADHKAILAAHDAYLSANAAFDWPALKPIWSDDPTNVFFNMNGHTYVGLEHWSRLWQYYAQHKESGWWEPFVTASRAPMPSFCMSARSRIETPSFQIVSHPVQRMIRLATTKASGEKIPAAGSL